MKILNRFLKVEKENRSFFQIFLWWESKRLLYMLIVFISGLLSWLILEIISFILQNLNYYNGYHKMVVVFVSCIFCHVFYTLGWIIELFIKPNVTFAPKMFKIVLYFTLFCVFLPALFFLIELL
ncbi:MAG: hypothetical protein ACEQSR_00425 [Candidatus Methylacidiphilales bacterium]